MIEGYLSTMISVQELKEMEDMLDCCKEMLAESILNQMVKVNAEGITERNVGIIGGLITSYRGAYRPRITKMRGRQFNLEMHDFLADNIERKIREFENGVEK